MAENDKFIKSEKKNKANKSTGMMLMMVEMMMTNEMAGKKKSEKK